MIKKTKKCFFHPFPSREGGLFMQRRPEHTGLKLRLTPRQAVAPNGSGRTGETPAIRFSG